MLRMSQPRAALCTLPPWRSPSLPQSVGHSAFFPSVTKGRGWREGAAGHVQIGPDLICFNEGKQMS